MAVQGIGTDLCAAARFEPLLARFGQRLLCRVLTPAERSQKPWDAPALARRWALKEAVAKAVGTGIGTRLGFQDIEITYDAEGAPQCTLTTLPGRLLISVSDERTPHGLLASAVALWMRE